MNLLQTRLAYKEEMNFTGNEEHLARVINEQKGRYIVETMSGPRSALVKGKMHYEAFSRMDFPAVGDWVILRDVATTDEVIIDEILPRYSKITRKVAGLKTDVQIVATNVTKVFIVVSAEEPLNARKLERYLAAVWDSGASPFIVFSKADLAEDGEKLKEEAELIAFGVPLFLWSAETTDGKEEILEHINPDDTIVLIGSSGVGKSTLINALLEADIQKTGAVRAEDKKGRHTTTHRELLLLPNGGVIIDTPGMRELQLWAEDDQSLSGSFNDISTLFEQCRFADCSHKTEPGCAVLSALEDGTLEKNRWQSYLKLQRELAYANRKQNARLASEEKKRWKNVTQKRKKDKY
ncbi:ribosome small subunit-dependent GTPase A [Alkalihalobacillus sp. 1P02AB]|uniref:ribosome small subunit-dependent GTPase A n=1 Tax=Alkalihalobacillus sp. 1P02AB TaxID=3132260 RepID=UPI0039A74954